MSHDVRFKMPNSDKSIYFDRPKDIRGGTYALGGTSEAWLNITYNYGVNIKKALGYGITGLYGKTAKEVITLIEKGLPKLKDDVDDDYWKPTEGNAKKALKDLVEIAKGCPPDATLEGD